MRQKLGLVFGFAINSASPRPLALLSSESRGRVTTPPPPFFGRRESVLVRNDTFKCVIFSQHPVRFILHKYCTYYNLFRNKVVTWHFI